MYKKIMNDRLTFPTTVDIVTQDLISLLLERDPNRRLSEPNMIKKHKFFEGMDWESLYKKQISPPYIPPVVLLPIVARVTM